MFNLLTSELYQVKQKRSTYVWLIIASAFSIALSQFLTVMNYLAKQTASGVAEDGVNFVVTSELLEVTPEINAEFASMVIAGLGIIILLLVAYHTFNSSLENRMIANTVMHGFLRPQIFISKYLIAGAFFILLISFSLLSFILTSMWTLGGSFSMYFETIVLDALLPYLAKWAFYLAIIISFLFLFESVMPIIIFYVVELLLINIVSNLSGVVSWLDKISPYLFFNLDTFQPQIHWGMNFTLIACLGYLAFFLAVGIALFQRKEIK